MKVVRKKLGYLQGRDTHIGDKEMEESVGGDMEKLRTVVMEQENLGQGFERRSVNRF